MPTPFAGRDLDALLAQAKWVRSLALHLCADVHAAEDAAQAAWLAVAQRPPRDGGKAKSYLARTLRNVLRMQRRGAQARDRHEREAAWNRAAEAPDTAALVERADLHRHVVAAVLELPPSQRDLLLWHYFEGEDLEALARRLRRSREAVRALLRRAREEVREGLERRGALRALATMTAVLEAPTALVPALLVGGIVHWKWTAVAAAAVAAVCLVVPLTPAHPDAEEASAPAGEAPMLAVRDPRADPAVTPAVLAREAVAVRAVVALRGRLVGADARVPWATPIAVHSTWTGGVVERSVSETIAVAADSTFAASLVPPAASAALARVQLRAIDAWYAPIDETFAADAVSEIVLRVEPAAAVLGRVADERGNAVADARVLVFATSGGVPKERTIAQTVSGADGTFRLRRDAPGDCLVVAVPGDDVDLVPGGVLAAAAPGFVDVGRLALAAAAHVTGSVLWAGGGTAASAEVGWRPRGVVLDESLGLVWCEGLLTRRRFATTDRFGRFSLPAPAGSQGSVMLQRVEGCHPASFAFTRKVTAPQEVELRAEGRPITIRVLRDGEPAGRCGVEWRREEPSRFAGNLGTDENGELRQLVLDAPLRLRAVQRDAELASEWVEFPAAPPDIVVLQLLPLAGERVAVRLLGGEALQDASFRWQPVAGGAAIVCVITAEDGTFRMRVPVGQHRVRVLGVRGRPSEYLLPGDHDVDVTANAELTLPVRLGGMLRLSATRNGVFVGGQCSLTPHGPAPSAARAELQQTLRFAAGRPFVTKSLAPGTYDLAIDVAGHGERRERVVIVAGATTDVHVRLP